MHKVGNSVKIVVFCCAVLCCAVLCFAALCYAVVCCGMLWCDLFFLWRGLRWRAVMHWILTCSDVLFCFFFSAHWFGWCDCTQAEINTLMGNIIAVQDKLHIMSGLAQVWYHTSIPYALLHLDLSSLFSFSMLCVWMCVLSLMSLACT